MMDGVREACVRLNVSSKLQDAPALGVRTHDP
jgi:hypothetical protein